jgi:hypothetical protein
LLPGIATDWLSQYWWCELMGVSKTWGVLDKLSDGTQDPPCFGFAG